MPSEETHEGLVLRSIDYKDRQKIITLYTPTRGLISLIVKGINRKKSHLLTLTSPFTKGEYHFQIGKSDLYTYRDGTPLSTHNNLRQNLSHLQAATTLLKALLTSQLPGKPAPDLYALTNLYLKHIPSFSNPENLTASFHLKILLHDGHLSPTHRQAPFTQTEWETLLPLLSSRTLQPLRDLPPAPLLNQKIETFFQQTLCLKT
ncbi:MAG: DNA repair protein RecO [Simkaniaceae bacterium]|nr:DNA repair protein RecO [Candidatus Sacchlamyda saccharinae]